VPPRNTSASPKPSVGRSAGTCTLADTTPAASEAAIVVRRPDRRTGATRPGASSSTTVRCTPDRRPLARHQNQLGAAVASVFANIYREGGGKMCARRATGRSFRTRIRPRSHGRAGVGRRRAAVRSDLPARGSPTTTTWARGRSARDSEPLTERRSIRLGANILWRPVHESGAE